ncbi:MAG: killer suppression protein HigA [Gemmatimonadetes bacterium]|nr:killer suppression protein HigA [Gemmatimonadota bacterium]MDE3259599.1 killer suppression protein HigA [Gemmatimonadota bacterium]
MMRLAVLANASTLAAIPHTPPDRRHQLTGDREGQYAVDLDKHNRLIFAPNHDPVPLLDDGGVDIHSVTAITIIEVIDYH